MMSIERVFVERNQEIKNIELQYIKVLDDMDSLEVQFAYVVSYLDIP